MSAMGPVEEERWERVDREPAVAPPSDPPVARAPVESYYSRTTGGTEVRAYDPRAERVIWFLTGLIASLIAIRFFMKLLGASMAADFVRFIYGVTGPLVAPFRGIFPATGTGNNILEPESLIAIAIYLLIGWAIVALVRIVAMPRSRPAL
jgi:uncharacterized protein YggT (Ycf19 family)